ncbi:hypothetical protein [Paenibacillus radicis (ex Gao et al. 2016)]|uniref:Uncharacterized protein n=1 Tax=Paenibacillus radicis (ex Gao et al. 2016) TaxID=1737354 RepID=A0A917HKI1_9BACL|nr:hypothetical protein [Paenibacillus radicis (ex Gao et al. 2016)]GGG82020.1 hypothetical protein GCM10010918_44190 [Paenibacillus radicis (ex Gao et al. 2016)]
MSLCFSYFDDDKIFVASDSRVSITVNGKHYFVTDKYKKIRKIGDKVIFFSGDVELAERMFNRINEKSSLKSIEHNVQKTFTETKKKQPKDDTGFVIKILMMKLGKPAYYFINSEDLLLTKQDSSKGKIYAMGANQEEALAYCLEIKGQYEGIEEAILKSYEYVADEAIGGTLHCFIISKDGIMEGQAVINDSRPLRTYEGRAFPYHCDLRGNLIATNVNLSGNMNMTGGSISWANVGKPTYSASEVGALASSSPKLTNITSTGVYTGEITADQIRAGKITASQIDTTNLSVARLYQNGSPNNYVVLGGQYGDLELYYQGSNYFTVYNDIDSVTLKHRDRGHLRLSSVSGKAHPLGGWDFSGATVTGLNTVSVFG